MKPCPACQQKAEWRYKEGWGALACADWFVEIVKATRLRLRLHR
jgi:hypothetical protein